MSLKIRKNKTRAAPSISRINQDFLPRRRDDEKTVSLTDVNDMNL